MYPPWMEQGTETIKNCNAAFNMYNDVPKTGKPLINILRSSSHNMTNRNELVYLAREEYFRAVLSNYYMKLDLTIRCSLF